jgi:uncharacterized protein
LPEFSNNPTKLIKNRLIAGLALLLAAYLLVCAYMYAQQGQLMYRPQRHTVPALLAVMSDLPAGSMLDTERHAIVTEPPQSASRGTVIFYHGNSGHAWKYLHYYRHFHTLGYRLVLAEYPGFGWRDGQPNEPHIVREALALYEHWRQRTPSQQPVILLGKSLGTGVATQVAAQASVPPSKLVLLTPFSSITEVAADKYWMLPVSLLLKDTFASDKHLPRYAGPVSILIAGRDEVVGANTGLQLLELARQRGPTTLIMRDEDDHNSWMPLLTTQEWQQLLH